MSHSLICDKCQSRLKLRADKTSFRGNCPKCGTRIDWAEPVESDDAAAEEEFEAIDYRALSTLPPIPAKNAIHRRSSGAKPNDASDTLKQLLAGFKGTLPRRGPGIGYRIALLATAFAVVVLIIVYFAIIAAAGYATYWYAMNILPTGLQFRGRASVLILVFHASVVFAGLATLLSLAVPLVPRRNREGSDQGLSISEAPVLHAFVARIADALGSPPPAEIQLSLSVNASASYQGGIFGLFSRRLVLTLGAPLIAGMNTQQLAGIIAHELGHFSQSGGLALRHFLTGFVNWCSIASGVQSSIADNVTDGDFGESSAVAVFRFVIWATHSIGSLIIWCLAMTGMFVTMFVSRRQEFDADRYEAELVGSDAYFGTVRRLIELNMGFEEVFKRGPRYVIDVIFQPGGYETLAAEVVAAADAKAHRAVKQIEKELQQPTGWFDSHPGHRERIAAARATAQPGIFHTTMPAWKLYPKLNPNSE